MRQVMFSAKICVEIIGNQENLSKVEEQRDGIVEIRVGTASVNP